MRYMPPCAALSGLVTSYYVMEAPAGVTLDDDDYLIPEWPNLRCLVRGGVTMTLGETKTYAAPPATAVLFGSTTMATKVHLQGQIKVIGVGLFPRGWRELIGVPAQDWSNRMDHVCEAWGHDPATVWAALATARTDSDIVRLLDQLLMQTLRHTNAPLQSAAAEMVENLLVDPDIASVENIAERTGLSLRQIERISLRSYGHAPKQVIRKFRFLRTIATLARTPDAAWKDMIDLLYYDQSHFIRDFKKFTSLTPTAYQKKPPLLMKGYLRSLGTAISLQTLPGHFELEPLPPPASAPLSGTSPVKTLSRRRSA
jgi:AraC-like DNA-binding protein